VRIEKVNIYRVLLPFTGEFSISRLKGVSSNTVVAEVIAEQGKIKGYGEGIPVEFVTGETPESVVKSISRFTQETSFPWELNDVTQIWDFVDDLPKGKEHNAAICACEVALLDALAKHQAQSIIEYFPRDFRTNQIYYGAPIALGNRAAITAICKLIKEMDINHLRIKMGTDFKQNKDAIETVNSIFDHDCELRIDPNGVWDLDLAFRHLPLIEKYRVSIVEEPMMRDSPGFEKFAEAIRSMGITLMACESAPTLEHVQTIIREGYYQMINVKLSRSGGFRRSLNIIERIRESDLSFQIGCTLGESGILSAAGRVLCLLSRDAANYDGSYDTFILKENTTVNNVAFGRGGKAGPLGGPGLGVDVNIERLKRLPGTSTLSILKP
jgi:L-alanine-DL-glutamate epimerase-like enolase superfamily enzyme